MPTRLARTKIIDIELSRPLTAIGGLDGYSALKGLVRLHGMPMGYIQVPVSSDCLTSADLGQAILDQLGEAIVRHLVERGLGMSQAGELKLSDLTVLPGPVHNGLFPPVTVAVCTRDRTDNLAVCLQSLCQIDYPALEILVVDNAPSSNTTEQLIRTGYPGIHYVCEPRPGLNWARNRAIIEARGEIIAYTDDDVVVDRGWASALARVFAENPEVMAVTGLIVPYELETEAQILFELYGGLGRGFERKHYRLNRAGARRERYHVGASIFGAGANMAYRRTLFDQIGPFDPALDVGTVTNGGGDLEMFFRVLKEGHTLVYEPGAIVRHRHRRDYAHLRVQLANNSRGFISYLVRSAIAYPDEVYAIVRLWLWWLSWHIRRLLVSFVDPARFPRDLILAELGTALTALSRYPRARRDAAKIAAAPDLFGDQARRGLVK